jgi:transposase-like protein
MPSKYHRKNSNYKPTGRKAPPTGTDADLNMASLSRLFNDEAAAREWLEAKRWPDGKPFCPHCGEQGAYKLTAKPESKHPVAPGTYKCKACRKKFTVRVGTIFEDSHIPICKWLMAFHLMASSKKGVSSHQLARELDITVKSAWFVSHRVRECMKMHPVRGMLKGIVEADETWVGGKPRYAAGRTENKPIGRAATKKSPVMVLVERDGQARCQPIPNVTADELKKHLQTHMSPDAALITDEGAGYGPPGREFFTHRTVNHTAKEYARRDPDGLPVSTNQAESFFALLKRGHYGVFHQLSKQHLDRYCTEFEFRWNARKVSDGERMVKAIEGAEGRRLTYKQPKEGKSMGG